MLLLICRVKLTGCRRRWLFVWHIQYYQVIQHSVCVCVQQCWLRTLATMWKGWTDVKGLWHILKQCACIILPFEQQPSNTSESTRRYLVFRSDTIHQVQFSWVIVPSKLFWICVPITCGMCENAKTLIKYWIVYEFVSAERRQKGQMLFTYINIPSILTEEQSKNCMWIKNKNDYIVLLSWIWPLLACDVS